MPEPPNEPDGVASEANMVRVAVGLAIVLSIVGFVVGTRRAPEPAGYLEAPGSDALGVAGEAPLQREMAEARYRARRDQQRVAFAALGPGEARASREPRSPAERRATLAARAVRRAYDGAPPTVPHAVDTFGTPACLVCHAEGARFEDRVAPAMSHEAYTSCLQCHAAERGQPFETAPDALPLENAFVGLPEPQGGARAWIGAPPVIPHRTFMRERCASCHVSAASGISTSHPHRQSCTQCHAPSADLDQRVSPRRVE